MFRARLSISMIGALLAVGLTTGCGQPPDDGQGGTSEACSASQRRDSTATTSRPTALVVDHTAFGVSRPLSSVVMEELRQAQVAGEELQIFGVNGENASPLRSPSYVLNPDPSNTSQDGNDERADILGCVARWVSDPALHPTAPGSDILAAINEAARQNPARIIVSSDGVATSGELTLNKAGFDDIENTVTELAKTGLFVPLQDMKVTWVQLGDTVDPLRQPVRDAIQLFWATGLKAAGATTTFDSTTAPPLTEADTDRPEDPFEPPRPSQPGVLPNSVLFQPNSSQLSSAADEVLLPIAQQLVKNPNLVATIEAHCADFGPVSGQMQMTTERATAIKSRLVQLGAPAAKLHLRPMGATRPEANEWPQGRSGPHDLNAAAQNRRVVITLGT